MVSLEQETRDGWDQMKKLYSELYDTAIAHIFCEVRLHFSPFLLFWND